MVLFLVFIGGVVRSTGAGLGCPDWPKCFGLWIPPVHISEIPSEFWQHPLSSENGNIIFNPIKTWTEYLNRLLGVIIGFAILFQAIISIRVKGRRISLILSLISLLLVLFQGWLGARVVSSDLRPLIISIHLVVALVISLTLLAGLFFAFESTKPTSPLNSSRITFPIVWLTCLVLFIQFFLGTEVRSQIDALFREFDFASRDLYVDRLDLKFLIHRSFSILAFILLLLQAWYVSRILPVRFLYVGLLPAGLAFLLMISGIILTRFAFPAFAQPFHLLFGLSIICGECWLCLHLWFSKIQKTVED